MIGTPKTATITILSLLSVIVVNAAVANDVFLPLGTKSRYAISGADTYTAPPQQCKVTQVQLLSRHGTRNPTQDAITSFQNFSLLFSENPSVLHSTNFSFLHGWQNPYRLDAQGMLVSAGRKDMHELADRALKRYPNLMNPQFHDKWHVTSTKINRTIESANAFLEYLLGPDFDEKVRVRTKCRRKDFELRPFDNCPRFSSKARARKVSEEAHKFIKKHFNKVANRLNTVFFPSSSPLVTSTDSEEVEENDTKKLDSSFHGSKFRWTHNSVDLAFQLCAYQVAIDSIDGEWCSLFKADELELFDYAADLGMYYSHSYGGGEINKQLACVLLTNMTNTFLDNESAPVHLKFAHAETVVPFLTVLGLFEPKKHLDASWDENQRKARTWRSSLLSPFASNVWIEKAQCYDSQSPKIRVLVHDKAVQFDKCAEKEWCTTDEWVKMFQNKLGCDMKRMCSNGGRPFYVFNLSP